MSDDVDGPSAAVDFWDDLYRSNDRVWSGNPNAVLVREVTGTAPGRALDLGCADGADAIWLAQQGWRITAVDISQVALDRAAGRAAAAGVADRIDWQRHDLAASFPAGAYDLVSAQFLHSYFDFPRERILRDAAAAVLPGGVLLIVGHAGHPSWDHHPGPRVHLPTPEEVVDGLELPAGHWEILLSDTYERSATGPDGEPATRTDNTLKIRRLPG